MSDAPRARFTVHVWTVAALGAMVLAFAAPLGLASGEAVDLGGVALGARRSFGESFPLADLLIRLFALIPVGEAGVRAHALAAAAGVVTLALLAPGKGGGDVPDQDYFGERLVGQFGAIALLALSRPFLDVGTVRPTTAVDLALFVAGIRLAGAVRVAGATSRAGLGLAFVCGLASGVGWPVRAVLWPVGVLLTLQALRRGHRWALLAPTVFVAGLLPLIGAVVASSAPPTVVQVVARIFAVPPHPAPTVAAFSSAALAVGEDVGVLAMLVVALGLWALVRDPPSGLIAATASWLAIIGAAVWTGEPAFARCAAVAALGMPLAAGVASLSAIFGRARTAVALVVVVVAVVPAAWVGLGSALSAPGRRAPAALARRLDAAPAPAPGLAPPEPAAPSGSDAETAARWWRYRSVIGASPP